MVMKTKLRCISGLVVCVFIAGTVMNGCASSTRTDRALEGDDSAVSGSVVGDVVVFEGGSYQEVFDAAREVIRGYRFAINRVDASRGVITTQPKRTLGLGSVWDREQSTLGQELEDFANEHKRTVRVQFERTASGDSSMQADGAGEGVVRATIEVMVHRVHRPHMRIETESIRLSSQARSRDSSGRVEPVSFSEPLGHDLAFARRLAREIQDKLH